MSDIERDGPATDYMTIDLTTTTPPFKFRDVFKLADEFWAARTAVSRVIVCVTGAGSLTLRTQRQINRVLEFVNGESLEVEALGIEAASGITKVKVLV